MNNLTTLPKPGHKISVISDRFGNISGIYQRYYHDKYGRVESKTGEFLCWLSCCSSWKYI